MFATKRSVEFEYAFSAGRWRLVHAGVDWEVAKLLGSILLNYPRVIEPSSSPERFATQLLVALAEHKLDGGDKREVFDDDHLHYQFMIVVDDRREKPRH
jgi:hypothetical protein